MKKVFLLLSILGISFFIKETQNNKMLSQLNGLTIENVEALAASGEIIVGPFCIQASPICFVDSDGFFLRGYRQYF